MWLLFFIRSVLFSFVVLPLVTLFCSISLLTGVILLNKEETMEHMSQLWARVLLWFLNTEVVYKGEENIPDDSCLFLFNHTSNVDIFVIYAQFPHIKFGAKIELFAIPIFGRALRAAGILPIARGRREEVLKVYQEAQERVQLGEQFALAPEGGRSENENLRPFKSGPFIFAINAGIPVVPVVIKGAHKMWNNKSIIPQCKTWRNKVTVQFLHPIATKEYSFDTRSSLQALVFDKMKQAL